MFGALVYTKKGTTGLGGGEGGAKDTFLFGAFVFSILLKEHYGKRGGAKMPFLAVIVYWGRVPLAFNPVEKLGTIVYSKKGTTGRGGGGGRKMPSY